MGDYPNDAPDMPSDAVAYTSAVVTGELDCNQSLDVKAHFEDSAWGQAVLVHELPYGEHPVDGMNPKVFVIGDAKDCNLHVTNTSDSRKAYLISAWTWYERGNSGEWTQVPKVQFQTLTLPHLGIIAFLGPVAGLAPGPAGNVRVTYQVT
jgi:hypothetical protein